MRGTSTRSLGISEPISHPISWRSPPYIPWHPNPALSSFSFLLLALSLPTRLLYTCNSTGMARRGRWLKFMMVHTPSNQIYHPQSDSSRPAFSILTASTSYPIIADWKGSKSTQITGACYITNYCIKPKSDHRDGINHGLSGGDLGDILFAMCFLEIVTTSGTWLKFLSD